MTFSRRQLLQSGLVTAATIPIVSGTTGCATLCGLLQGLVKQPELSLKSFKVTKTTLSMFSVNIVALLRNPNPFGFRIDGLDWNVKLQGGAVASGRFRKGITLKPRGTSENALDIDFNIARTAEAILDMLDKNAVTLGLDAVAHLRANKYRFDVPADYETTLPLPKLPTFDVPRFAVRNASASGISFSVEPLVHNLNPFDLDIDSFDFGIKLGGRDVLRNKRMRNVKLASKERKRLPFDFDVDLVDLGLSLAKLAQNPRLDWEVGTHLKSGILDLPFRKGGRLTL
jgi:LEA14-like dessication related protein